MKSTDYSRTVEVFKGSPWEAELVKGLLEKQWYSNYYQRWTYEHHRTLYSTGCNHSRQRGNI